KGLVADDVTCTPDRMAEPQRLLLTGEAGFPCRRKRALQIPQGRGLAPRLERCFEFQLTIKMIFDDGFITAGDEDEMLDPSFLRLIDGVLDERTINDGQHFLGHCLRCRQESRPQTRNGEYSGSDAS